MNPRAVDRHASGGRPPGEAWAGVPGASRPLCGLVLLALAVAGCGGDDDGTGPTPSGPLAFERSFLPGGFLGRGYDHSFAAATGGEGPVSYSIGAGALPPGLGLSGPSIEGVPTEPGMHYFEVVATAGGETESVVFAITISNNPPGGFNLFGLTGAEEIPQPRIRAAIDDAFRRWESIVTGDLGQRPVPGDWFGPSGSGGECIEGELVNGRTLEDVYLFVDIGVLDGSGGGGNAVNTLGRAGPCLGFGPQGGPILTSVAQMVLDSEDLGGLSDTRLAALVWHEIAHGIGVGTWWNANGHLQGSGTTNPLYEGVNALTEYNTLLDGGAAAGVPVEGSLGQGSDGTHWDEATFNAEIMTAISEVGPQPVSRMTLASLRDGGYQVALDEAEAYELPACSPSCPEGVPAVPGGARPVDVVLPPPGYVTPEGRVIRFPRRAP